VPSPTGANGSSGDEVDHIDAEVFARCGTQRGLITLGQMRELGLSDGEIRSRIERGWLVRVEAKVFAVRSSPADWAQQVTAAVLAGGPDVLATQRSATRLWNLSGATSRRVEVVVPRGMRRRITTGRVVETTDLRASDAAVRHGIPVTALPRTLIDVGASVGPRLLAEMADDAVRRKLTTYDEILDRFVRLARRGRPGVARMRTLLGERLGVDLTANDFERMVLEIVADHGLPAPVCQHPVIIEGDKYFLDLAWPEHRRFVECDGWETHGTPQALVEDLERQNKLVLAGWVPLRFAYRTVKDRPGLVARQIRSALT